MWVFYLEALGILIVVLAFVWWVMRGSGPRPPTTVDHLSKDESKDTDR
ncbi:MAG: hypothetical protein WA888_10990 [Burkholderiaceae bacterium]